MSLRDRSDKIAFGLAATSVALLAKQGLCRDHARLDLVAAALRFKRFDDVTVAAVLAFVELSRLDPVQAGADLHDFIIRSACGHQIPDAVEFDWQRRVDING